MVTMNNQIISYLSINNNYININNNKSTVLLIILKKCKSFHFSLHFTCIPFVYLLISWVTNYIIITGFDLVIVLTNFVPNIAMAIL